MDKENSKVVMLRSDLMIFIWDAEDVGRISIFRILAMEFNLRFTVHY